MDVEGQLSVLVKLQELELAIRQFEAAIDAKPRELDPLIHTVDQASDAVTQHRQELEALDRQRRQLETAITDQQSDLQKAQRKLLEVKTNKEYSAMMSEIDAVKQKISGHEDTVLHILELVEVRKQELVDIERQVEAAGEALAHGRQRNTMELSVLRNTLTERQQRREGALRQLDRPVMELYLRLLQNRKGLAVVGIKEGTCQGCFLSLPPQLIQEVRRNDRILTCSHCQRILYWGREASSTSWESEASELAR